MIIRWWNFIVFVNAVNGKRDSTAETSKKYWNEIASQELHHALRGEILNRNIAKNVILFIGDGMGISTQTAGRIFKAQKYGLGGEEIPLAMDKLPHVALSRTYSVDRQIPDEADTATAILCGIKTKSKLLALTGRAHHELCRTGKGRDVQSVLIDASSAGKSTGIVTTKRIVDSTVAAAYAHSVSDKWYSDARMTVSQRSNCKDIAMQFYEASVNITVALGGGRKYMFPNTMLDTEYEQFNERQDGNNLIEMWENRERSKGLNPIYVWNKTALDRMDIKSTDRLIGLFEPDDMRYELNRTQDVAGEPSIAEMTSKALAMLQKNEKGYLLLVEGGRVDDSHHDNVAHQALNDFAAFDDAIETAMGATSPEDTMIIVTSDHGNVMTFGSLSKRGENILGVSTTESGHSMAYDEKSMTSLQYGNGPGYKGYSKSPDRNGRRLPYVKQLTPRLDPNSTDTAAAEYQQQSAVPLEYATHGGEDVPILASGPMSHLFHGVHEQHYIAHVIRYALCIGDDTKHCEEGYKSPGIVAYLGGILYVTEAERMLRTQFICIIVLSVLLFLALLGIIYLYRQAKASANSQLDQHASQEIDLSITR